MGQLRSAIFTTTSIQPEGKLDVRGAVLDRRGVRHEASEEAELQELIGVEGRDVSRFGIQLARELVGAFASSVVRRAHDARDALELLVDRVALAFAAGAERRPRAREASVMEQGEGREHARTAGRRGALERIEVAREARRDGAPLVATNPPGEDGDGSDEREEDARDDGPARKEPRRGCHDDEQGGDGEPADSEQRHRSTRATRR